MANEWRVPVDPDLGPFYARAMRASDGLRWNGSTWNELGASALSAYVLTATQNANFEDEQLVDRPGGVDADTEVIVELLAGDGGSPLASDPLVAATPQGPGVEEVLDALGEIASDLFDTKTAVEADLFTADAEFCRDSSADEYVVTWRRNVAPLTSGITGTPTITVKNFDGTTLVAETAMTAISTGRYSYSEADDRAELGDPVEAIFKATIDGIERTVSVWFKRDAAE